MPTESLRIVWISSSRGATVQTSPDTMQSELAASNEASRSRLTLNNEQLQELTGLGRDKILELLRSGRIPSVRVGRRYLVTRAHLEAFLGRSR